MTDFPGTNGPDTLVGAGTDDRLFGGLGDDTLNGGFGDDTLFGGQGNDTFLFTGGQGNDVIGVDESGANDRVLLGSGITSDEVRLVRTRYGASNELSIVLDDGSSSSVRLAEHFAGAAPSIEKLVFANGDEIDLTGKLTITGSDVEDKLLGTDFDDKLDGDAGVDTLFGGQGKDNLVGGAGDDWLYGGEGNDTYYCAGSSFGYDVVRDDDGGVDTVRLSLSLARTYLLGQGQNLLIAESAGRSAVTVEGQYDGDGPSVEKLLLAGGTTLDLTRALAFRGGKGNDVIGGTRYGDTIIGGAGDDYLAGGDGKDTYVFARGWGSDRVVDASGTSTIMFDGLLKTQLTYVNQGYDRVYYRTGSDDELRLVNFNNGAKFSIKYAEAGFSKVIFGSGGSDILRDAGGGDVFRGAGGRDTFLFMKASDSPERTPDTILDFGSGDKIDLSKFDADTTTKGRQHFEFIDDDRFSDTAGELRFDDGILSGDTDGDGDADFAVILMRKPDILVTSFDSGDLILS